jgi:excisionase family DNA binding protein
MKHSANKIRFGEGGENGREFYTVSQLAELLQLTEMTIYRMISRGELPCYVIGRAKRFRSSDLETYLASCRMPSAAENKYVVEQDSPETRPSGPSQGN